MFAIARQRRPRAPRHLILALLGSSALGLLAVNALGAQQGPIQLFPQALPSPQGGVEPSPGAPGPGAPPQGPPIQAPTPGPPIQGPPIQGPPIQGAPNQGAPNQGAPIQVAPIQAAPNQGAPIQAQPNPATPPEGGATTAPPAGFQVEGLAPPEVDSIGLTGPGDGGFERTLWAGSDPQLVLTLMADLPVATHNPALAALTRRLLATGAPLDGGPAGGRMLSARVERLLAMGDLDTAKRLLDQLPPSRGDGALARLTAQAALLEGDDAAACQRANDLAPTGGDAFWSQIAVYCRLAAGDEDGARLGLDLLRDANQTEDGAFVKLASAVADHRGDAAIPRSPSPVEVALLRLAGVPLPAAALADPEPAVLTAAAQEPSLAGDRQLEIAERAFQTGGLPASALGAIYGALAPAGDALASVRTAWGPKARAMAWRAAGEQQNPQDLAALLAATWQAAKGDERFLVARVFAKRFADLPIDRSLLAVAPSAARALLAADRPLPAARWFALLTEEGARDSRAQRQVAALKPLFALAGVGGSEAVPELDEAAVTAWRQATLDADAPDTDAPASDGPKSDAKAERLFALLDGLGSPVPDAVWSQELRPPLQRSMSVPVGAIWRGLERAAAAKRLGETVLYALHMLNGQPEAAHPEVLLASLRGLRAVGLDQEARQIAVATALAMDL